jgi:2-hydroxy-3-keto-5-methylthiopentenyl-1-phosphate phosphatase
MNVVLDWDGTVTEVDSLTMVLHRFAPGAYEHCERRYGDGWTLKEVIECEFAAMREPLEDVVGWMVENVRLRRGFHDFAEAFDPLILSSSFVETIGPILDREGIELRVVANSVEARPDGWRVRWRDDTVCSHCNEACKRGGLPVERPVVFVGDGVSDRCAALAADRVFARDGLARYLDERNVTYEPFDDFDQLADALRSGAVAA